MFLLTTTHKLYKDQTGTSKSTVQYELLTGYAKNELNVQPPSQTLSDTSSVK